MVDTEENQQRMLSKTLSYISHHAIAILALVCSLLALAGASYAATQLPKNSVGNPQIKQGAVAPPKFSKQIGGYVRMYAVINSHSELQYSSPQAKLSNWGNSPTPGAFSRGTVSWKSTVTAKQCAAFATAQESVPSPPSVSAVVVPNLQGQTGTHVDVAWTGDSAIAVEVVCH
jgi:hypothetical protein